MNIDDKEWKSAYQSFCKILENNKVPTETYSDLHNIMSMLNNKSRDARVNRSKAKMWKSIAVTFMITTSLLLLLLLIFA